MRTITVDLYPNDGRGTVLTAQALTGRIATLGQLSWEIDEQVTKVQPSGLSLKIADEDEVVWTWIQNQITTTVGGISQLFPPWIILTVSGARRFLGVVDVASVKRGFKDRTVELQGQDWSIMLRDQVLEGSDWERPLPKVISTRTSASLGTGTKSMLWGPTVVQFAGDISATVQVGDLLQANGTGPTYKVAKVQVLGSSPNLTWITLEGWNWGGGSSATWQRFSSAITDQAYYSATASVSGNGDVPLYEIPVDTVDFLVPGDVLERAGKGKVQVDDIDAERKIIISATPITEAFQNGDKLTLTAESRSEVVQQDAFNVLRRALTPFGLDASGYTAPSIPTPCFSWLPWWNAAQDENLRGISDAEPTLTALRFLGPGQSWTGTPGAGYTVSAGVSSRFVDWTKQQTTAPTYLLPDETPTYAPRERGRNRGYFEWKFNYPQLLNSSWSPITPVNTPVATVYPAQVLAHDYAALRRWNISNATWTEERWNGSTWTAPATVTPSSMSGGPWYPCSATPMVTTAATTGPTPLGKALLVLSCNSAGTSYQLQLHFVGASAVTASITPEQAKGARLVSTPYGAYLVGPGGYGRIVYSGGTLTLTWAQVVDASTCWLQPNTLAAIDSSSVWILARTDWADPVNKAAGSETRLLQLKAAPDSTPILNGTNGTGVRISHLPPRICAMFRDPSDSTRLVGILGSRLFQVASKLPTTIERLTVVGLTSAELLEHVCQAINAIAYPKATGEIALVARTDVGSPTAVTVDEVAITQSRISPNFFSVVRVSGKEDDVYADASGAWLGGRSMEVSGHPMIHDESMCFALSTSLVTFFGKPRRAEERTWCWENSDTAPTWEALIPWQKITVNGGSTNWLLAGMKEDLIKGEAFPKLLEA